MPSHVQAIKTHIPDQLRVLLHIPYHVLLHMPCSGFCPASMIPNGDFSKNKAGSINVTNWTKFKEVSTFGMNIVNGSSPACSGYPGYPFNKTDNVYIRSSAPCNFNASGPTAVALVNTEPFLVPDNDTVLYFDWFVDNPSKVYFVPNTMSSYVNFTNQQVSIDIYDSDKLPRPGDVLSMGDILFNKTNATAGDAYLGNIIYTDDKFASVPSLQAMGYVFPLSDFFAKKLHIAFRITANYAPMLLGVDNVQTFKCDWDSLAP